jgi:hypothetical protein
MEPLRSHINFFNHTPGLRLYRDARFSSSDTFIIPDFVRGKRL